MRKFREIFAFHRKFRNDDTLPKQFQLLNARKYFQLSLYIFHCVLELEHSALVSTTVHTNKTKKYFILASIV